MTQATYLTYLFARFHKYIGALSERRIVSKPQSVSRLRHVNIVKPIDETPQEKAYRTEYQSIQQWNNDYWSKNNDMFNREKSDYIQQHFGKDTSPEDTLNHDQLAPFYRYFLEKNRQRQIDYNRIWYRNHGLLLLSAIKAKTSRISRNFISSDK